MLYNRFVGQWLTDDEAVFQKNLIRITVIFLVSLLPWALGIVGAFVWIMVKQFDGDYMWLFRPFFLLLIYPLTLILYFVPAWVIWVITKRQKIVMLLVWWPLTVIIVGGMIILVDVIMFF